MKKTLFAFSVLASCLVSSSVVVAAAAPPSPQYVEGPRWDDAAPAWTLSFSELGVAGFSYTNQDDARRYADAAGIPVNTFTNTNDGHVYLLFSALHLKAAHAKLTKAQVKKALRDFKKHGVAQLLFKNKADAEGFVGMLGGDSTMLLPVDGRGYYEIDDDLYARDVEDPLLSADPK